MSNKTRKLMDEAFEKADEAFAKADEAFASMGTAKGKTQRPVPSHQHRFDFVAPTWKHRRKLFRVFINMSWQMLRYGRTQLQFNRQGK